MKFDKETIVMFAVCAVVLIAWDPVCRYMGWMPARDAAPAAQVQKTPPPAASVPVPNVSPSAASPAKPVPVKNTAKVPDLPPQTIANPYVKLSFLPASGVLESVEFTGTHTADGKRHLRSGDALRDRRFALYPGALALRGDKPFTVLEVLDNSRTSDHIYTLVRRLADANGGTFILTEKFTLVDQYPVSCRYTIRNLGKTELRFPTLYVGGGAMGNWEMMSGDKTRMETFRIDYCTAGKSFGTVKIDGDDEDFASVRIDDARWAAVSNKYYTAVLRSDLPFSLVRERFGEKDAKDKQVYYCAITGGFRDFTVGPGAERSFECGYYAGPKRIGELQKFDASASRIVHLSWGPIDYLARWLLWLLVFLKGLCGSYGWSIILLTVLVRLLFWPATAKANASMKKMQVLQPKIKELREKYKNEPQLLNTKTMELYRAEKVNPFSGCLPIILQIPVFFALYAALEGAVELRQVSFWWCANLAGPDTVAMIPLMGWSLPLNPLVIAMTLLMVLQQRMTPSAMDPAQQKMMLLMPVVMLFFLYDLPSGLTLYWTVSQIFSILQLLVQQKKLGFGGKTTAAGANSKP